MQQIYNLFPNFSDSSRVWIYTANRAITSIESDFVQTNLELFSSEWKAHSQPLKAKACMLNEFTVVFVVDQSITSASGCSVDSSVRFVKELGKELEIDFFNRLNVLVQNNIDSSLYLYPYRKLNELTSHSYFNPLVEKLKDLKDNWLIELK